MGVRVWRGSWYRLGARLLAWELRLVESLVAPRAIAVASGMEMVALCRLHLWKLASLRLGLSREPWRRCGWRKGCTCRRLRLWSLAEKHS
jgi:hypothetical protein